MMLINNRQRQSYLDEFYAKRGWHEREDMANFVLPLHRPGKVTRPLVIGARLRRYPQFTTLGPRPNLEDYSPQELELIRRAPVVFYPTEALAPSWPPWASACSLPWPATFWKATR